MPEALPHCTAPYGSSLNDRLTVAWDLGGIPWCISFEQVRTAGRTMSGGLNEPFLAGNRQGTLASQLPCPVDWSSVFA